MKRFTFAIVALLLAGTPVLADPPQPVIIVAQVLNLSPDQVTAFAGILQQRQTAIQPLIEQLQAKQQSIGQLLGAANPDPLAIGQALIDIHALQLQVGAANAASAKQFEQILTPDQLQRLNAIRGGAQVCPIVPAFQATGLL